MCVGLYHNPAREKVFYRISMNGARSSMSARQIAGTIIGAFMAFLGLLWFLQGIGILRIRPILCIANCEEIVGPSPSWAASGAIVFVVGTILVAVSARRA